MKHTTDVSELDIPVDDLDLTEVPADEETEQSDEHAEHAGEGMVEGEGNWDDDPTDTSELEE